MPRIDEYAEMGDPNHIDRLMSPKHKSQLLSDVKGKEYAKPLPPTLKDQVAPPTELPERPSKPLTGYEYTFWLEQQIRHIMVLWVRRGKLSSDFRCRIERTLVRRDGNFTSVFIELEGPGAKYIGLASAKRNPKDKRQNLHIGLALATHRALKQILRQYNDTI